MSQTPKFDLAIIGLGYVGLPLGLQFTKSGVRFFEDHAVIDENEVAAGSGSRRDAGKQQNKVGRDWFWIRESGSKRPRVATCCELKD